MDKRVGEAQVQFTVLISARQAHAIIKAMADVDEVVIPAVIAVQNVAHGIKTKTVNQSTNNKLVTPSVQAFQNRTLEKPTKRTQLS